MVFLEKYISERIYEKIRYNCFEYKDMRYPKYPKYQKEFEKNSNTIITIKNNNNNNDDNNNSLLREIIRRDFLWY
ncbi:hypothetical protein Glove_81g57 [Diversispora epigaea]|uniref:Uncharacterized protein n=1 Tax=Diversispora epigaea TaxID=1348612 RepID=A0A397JBJ8_9GLOM|nr:hypothetical protein Glove_81g57 [Diversispora epigaea]